MHGRITPGADGIRADITGFPHDLEVFLDLGLPERAAIRTG